MAQNGNESSTPLDYDQIPGPLGLEAASLAGKVALVTGAGRGIGREIALELGRRGASVVVNFANSASHAAEVVAMLQAMPTKAVAIQADVSSVPEITRLFAEARAAFGRGLDIVVSNSGVISFGHMSEVTPEEFDRVFRVNVRGQFFVAQEAYKNLEHGGRLIMMGSIAAQAKGVRRHAIYNSSKAAVEGLVRGMAVDCADKKITVNCVAPGGIKSDMYRDNARKYIPGGEKLTDAQVDEAIASMSPLHRVGLPIDVARVVCFLASHDGGWINGKVIGIDGGAPL
ncbi:Putative short-chain dehydrogenase/reductase SDR, NAD(P)-binding domain superfamily [Colletotrichum destructivum]|uniref:Short-chain dehydrogenase/reductase SDR, NAD(P)-binding domain superfamily n=1 Tax=Colletotrichum destructivum TaxID=34406 RepID=A0AAX4J1G2_9PEZI|nr:Putative short-chain dehydrogenase/reductase SDR, NAD(P)-binding domain superfamily [Colletotrichum destructivum]